jgi:hypothetical protein
MKRILWLNSDHMACGTYRCYQPANYLLRTRQYNSYFLQHTEANDQGGPRLQNLQDIDLVVLQRAVNKDFLVWIEACRERGIPVVYEMDDDIFHVARHNPAYQYWGLPSHRRLSRELICASDHVIVSTPPLKDMVVDQTGISPKDVTVCYNFLDADLWGPPALLETA